MRASTEIPGPPPANSIGGAYQLMKAVRADLLGLVLSAFEEYGDIFQLRVLGRRQVLVRSPELIRQVLVTEAKCFEKGADYTSRRKGLAKFGGMGLLSSNGALWKQQRKLVAPALHAKRVAAYADAMVRAADEAMEPWTEGDVVAMDDAMMHAALHIVGRTMFHEEVGASADVIGEATHALHGMLEANNSAWTLLPAWFPTPQRMREDRAVRRIDEVVYRLIRARRPTEDGPVEDTGDLAALLLGAEYEGGGRMTDEQARDEIVTMFIAGHETAANTLGWAWVELAREPEVAAKLHAELDRVLMGRSPTADDYHALDYTRAFIKETLRRWPPAFTFLRTCVADTQIGDFQIEKGMDVSLVPYATHRDPRFFEDPERFDPERFLGERGDAMDRYAWIPFGGGPRVCVGNAFALMETTLVLARIASRYRLELVEGQDVVPVPGVTLRPSGPLRMRVSRR
ncbi:MAG: cytochrome P450 [Sandaracinaceae bacterium]|nr:cytochrome P450 [Sandaracinaceae bacterium]